jgi:hypothetical protein
MPLTCFSPGCGALATRFGHYCTTHKARRRRHGHPMQLGVTKAELKGYIGLVKARISKNPHSPVWATCEDRWQALVGHSIGAVQDYQGGRPVNRYRLSAATHVARLGQQVPARTIVETVLAMFVMQDQQARRFMSDDAFRAQLVRRVTRLTDANAGEWFNAATGRMQRAYREIAPGTAKVLGGWLAESLGPIGLHLAALERRDEEAGKRQRHELHNALAELT